MADPVELYPDTPTGRILFPEKEVRLVGGRTAVIRPWGMATGRRLGPRVAALLPKLRGFSMAALAQTITEAQDEVYDIVQQTLGWDDARMDALAYEDLFTLADAVIRVCIVRAEPDGGSSGVGGKLLALAGLSPETLVAQLSTSGRGLSPSKIETSPSPSSISSLPVTPTNGSATTPSRS